MQVNTNLDPGSKAQIRQFFKENDPNEYIRQFLANRLGPQNDPGEEKPPKSTELAVDDENSKAKSPPSLSLEFINSHFADMRISQNTYFNFDITVFGSRFRFENIIACQDSLISQTIIIPFPFPVHSIAEHNIPIRICVTKKHNRRETFIGSGTCDWRLLFHSSTMGEKNAALEIQNTSGVIGTINVIMKLVGFEPDSIDFPSFTKVLTSQFKQERAIIKENERKVNSSFGDWWQQLFCDIDDKSISIDPSIMSYIEPFTIRELPTPGHCLQYSTLLNPLNRANTTKFLPLWSSIASRCGDEREKLHLLVSLLRGMKMRAFVAVAEPFCFAVTFGHAMIHFYDVRSGTFQLLSKEGGFMNDITRVYYLYNDQGIIANLRQKLSALEISWEIENQLKWKTYANPIMPVISNGPANLKIDEQPDCSKIEQDLMQIIGSHRSIMNMETDWNNKLSPCLMPVLASVEREAILGSTYGIHQMTADTLRAQLERGHCIGITTVHANSVDPNTIFKAFTSDTKGMSLLTMKGGPISYSIVVDAKRLPGGLYSTWAMLAADYLNPCSRK